MADLSQGLLAELRWQSGSSSGSMGRLAEANSMRTIHEAEYIITHLETSHESAGEYIVTPFPLMRLPIISI